MLDSNNNILQVKPTLNNTTIGYGYDLTKDPLGKGIKKATIISQDTALDYLVEVSNKYAKKIVNSADITIKLSQCQLDALVALRYNIGSLGAVPGLLNDINKKKSMEKFKKDIMAYYKSLVKNNPKLKKYLPGWENRVISILNIITFFIDENEKVIGIRFESL